MGRYLILVVTLLIVSCARTDVHSFKDPKFATHQFQSIVVYAPSMGLQEREVVESTAVAALTSKGIPAIRSMEIVPPTRNLSVNEAAVEIMATGYEAVLFFFETGKGTTETYVPPTYYPGSSTSTVNVVGNTAYVNTQTNPGYTTGGYSISKPVSAYSAALLHTRTGEVAWQADLSARGSAFDDYENLAKSSARSAVADLSRKGLLMAPTTPN